MPKFNGQNKKRIDPRYFLYESVEREDLIDDIREFSKAEVGSRDTYGDIDILAKMDVAELKEYFKSLINRDNSRLTSAVMQDDDMIPASKKIPSGLSEMNDSDEADARKDAKKLADNCGDWQEMKGTYQDAYDNNNNLTPYGKLVEKYFNELELPEKCKQRSSSRTVAGRLKKAGKASGAGNTRVDRKGKQIRENTDNLREDINDDDDLSLKYILKFTDNGRARPEFEEIERKFTNDRIVEFGIADILRIASNQNRDLERIRQAQRILMNMQYGDAAAESLLAAINKCRKG